jgi:uncharacterized protein
MGVFHELLELQEHDTAAGQLRHRRATLPERAELAELGADLTTHDQGTAELEAERTRLRREQSRVEDEVSTIETKAAEVDKTMYSGTVTSPRELQAFQGDLQSLRRRQRQLEDQVIALMEQIEPLDQRLDEREAERRRLAERQAAVRSALLEQEREVDAELQAVLGRREEVASSIEPDLLSRYDELRTQLGGIAVAPLVGTSCGGCHLTLSAVELDRIRNQPPDALVFCEECGRLLVR